MSTFDTLSADFSRMFDVTPNPKGAAPTHEALDERSPPPPAEGREP